MLIYNINLYNKNNLIFKNNNRFVKLMELKDKTSEAIFEKLIIFLKEIKILDKIVAICTDGEKAVSSSKNGVCGKL